LVWPIDEDKDERVRKLTTAHSTIRGSIVGSCP
jgi:hypothetical protein